MATDKEVKLALEELKVDENFQYLLSYPLTNVIYHKDNWTSAQSCLDLTAYGDTLEDWATFWSHGHISDLLNNSTKDDIKKYIMVFYFATVLLQVLANKIISNGKVFKSASSGGSLTAAHTNGHYVATRFWELYDTTLIEPLVFSLYDVNNTNEESSGGSLSFEIHLLPGKTTSNYMDWPIKVRIIKNDRTVKNAPDILNKLSDLNYTNIQKIVDEVY